MTFTNLQIWVIFLSFFTTIFLAILWQKRDQKSDKNKNNQEHFWVLMSVFFWSAFLAFTLKLWLDFLKNINFEYINTQFFWWFSIWMEEIVKISALIIWLEIAWKRFNEISDWVIYWVFAILWFLFFENIFYLLAYWDFATWVRDFAWFVWQRNIFSFWIHLSTLIFSVFYATAYLRIKKTNNPGTQHNKKVPGFILSRPKPRNFYQQFKTNKKLFFTLFWSFLATIFLHIWLDELMWLWWNFAFIWLVFSWFIWFLILRRFEKLDK